MNTTLKFPFYAKFAFIASETLTKQLRKQVDACSEKYNDAGTPDFLTGIMEEHETIAWILRRYLN